MPPYRREMEMASDASCSHITEDQYIVYSGGTSTSQSDLDDIPEDDVDMLKKLHDMQVCEMEFHERTWRAMHKNWLKIRRRLQVAMYPSERSRTTRRGTSPTAVSPRGSVREHMSRTARRSEHSMMSPFDEQSTPDKNISRTYASAASDVGRYSSGVGIKRSGTLDDAKENSYADGTSRRLHIPNLPLQRAHPHSLPPNAPTTIYVENIAFEADERDIVKFFNSVGGTFDDYCTALSAVNIPYKRDRKGKQVFVGQGFFMYSTCSLARFAWSALHHRMFKGRPLRVEMAKRPLVCGSASNCGARGQLLWGEGIFEIPPRT